MEAAGTAAIDNINDVAQLVKCFIYEILHIEMAGQISLTRGYTTY
jgi:hypothetical protein